MHPDGSVTSCLVSPSAVDGYHCYALYSHHQKYRFFLCLRWLKLSPFTNDASLRSCNDADGWPVESNDSILQEWMVILHMAQADEHKCLFNTASLSTSPLIAHSVNHPGEDNLPPVALPKIGLSDWTCCGTVHDSTLIPPSRRKISPL